jgi:hypothetical protein
LEFNIEKPLWVFVGNTVSGEESDILEVVNFLAEFLNDEEGAKACLAELVADRAQLLDAKGNNIFKGRFTPLLHFAETPNELYADILVRLFNANAKQRLKLVNIKSSKGELALRVGDNHPFGLISIGDDAGFFAMAESREAFDCERDSFGGALFSTLNSKDSMLNILIGSRKFTEGWSSWRVSTMGLLNMGQGEGSQIIQLFGRGVRLKGRALSLKRTLAQDRPKGLHLDKLETLNIFGVRATYMAVFKDYLKQEGVTPSDEILELDFPTKTRLPARKLKTLSLRDGFKDGQDRAFRRMHFPWLYEVPDEFKGKVKMPRAMIDMYPRVEAMATAGRPRENAVEARNSGKIDKAIMPFFDWDRIYLELQDAKRQRGWSNVRMEQGRLIEFCISNDDWYDLFIPRSELTVNTFSAVRRLEGVLVKLLVDYTERFYKMLRSAYEGQHYEVTQVDESHGSIIKLYQFEIDNSDDGAAHLRRLEVLKQLVAEGDIGEASKWNMPHMVAISFDRHLFYPLLSLEDKDSLPLRLRPLAFDSPSEWNFVKALESFYSSDEGRKAVGGRSLYLLRNASREDKGLGFALAGNFYPDFLLWLVDDNTGQQWLAFVDPKGLRNLDLSSPKLGLYREIKVLEKELALRAKKEDPAFTLSAFILSPTRFEDIPNVGNFMQQTDLEQRNVLFMSDGGPVYLRKLFSAMT